MTRAEAQSMLKSLKAVSIGLEALLSSCNNIDSSDEKRVLLRATADIMFIKSEKLEGYIFEQFPDLQEDYMKIFDSDDYMKIFNLD